MLTGYPARVHKRTAIIKHMFYNPEDVSWFKPIELTTKHGLSGHIQGTCHAATMGHMHARAHAWSHAHSQARSRAHTHIPNTHTQYTHHTTQGACGDHGLFKVHFGRQVQGHDTICLNLFKRVYPKFVDPRQLEDEEGSSDGLGTTQITPAAAGTGGDDEFADSVPFRVH